MTDDALIALESELDAVAAANDKRQREDAAEADRARAEREAEEVRAALAAMSDDDRAAFIARGQELLAEGCQARTELLAYQSSLITTPMFNADMRRVQARNGIQRATLEIQRHLGEFVAASNEIADLALESGIAPPAAEPHAEELKQLPAEVSAAVERAIESLRLGFRWSHQTRHLHSKRS